MSEEPGHTRVDENGFSLPAVPESVLDVYFGEHRVFSVAPSSVVTRHGQAHLEWPRSLKQHLRGSTQLRVMEHVSGKVLIDEPIQLGSCTEPISVTDRRGRPLAVDKFGGLVRMFAEADESTAHHLAVEVGRLAEDVNDFGVAGFLAYGSLLGAVRTGRLIGHDTDVDMAYLSNHDHPADIARESFALERFLTDRGWTIERMRIGLVRAVFADQAGDVRHIDIFIAVHDGSRFYLDPYVFVELPRSAIVPLSTVTFEGVRLPAPAEPGESWRRPTARRTSSPTRRSRTHRPSRCGAGRTPTSATTASGAEPGNSWSGNNGAQTSRSASPTSLRGCPARNRGV